MYLLGFLCATGLSILGCEDDDTSIEESSATPNAVNEAQYLETQAATEMITGVSGDVFLTDTGTNKQVGAAKNNNCVERSSEETDGIVTVTLDYGQGCELDEDVIVSGIIKITYDLNDTANGATILTTLENYRYNEVSVNGKATSVYSIVTDTGNFKFSSETDFLFEWPDGLTATSEGLSETETVFEISNEIFDFYTLISGNGATEFSNGDRYTYEITTPLRTEIGCAYVVSGIVVTTENGEASTRNYGDGSCDTIATDTDTNGTTTTIDLDDDQKENDN